jgi:DNA (cytosine-5)-methyltransferase 1
MTSKPRLLDLCCGAGGGTKGYQRAGFYVVGVDIEPQPHYCGDEFYQADALKFSLEGFEAIHASPPCQGYTPMSNRWGSRASRLIEPIREALRRADVPYVIENVPGAALLNSVQLCGSFFGLTAYRHRLFESNIGLWSTPCLHSGVGVAVYGKPDGRRLFTRADGSELRAWKSLEEGKEALGIDWCPSWHGIREAIPPAYTQFIGEQLLEHLKAAA